MKMVKPSKNRLKKRRRSSYILINSESKLSKIPVPLPLPALTAEPRKITF